jgi:hypothetical protein
LISSAWSTVRRRTGRPHGDALLGGRPDSARSWRELGDLARARELAVRAVELVGAAAAASDPGLRAKLALAECAI